MDNKFDLEQEDFQVINFTRKYLHKVLKQYDLSPRQIIGIGNYLYALDRLPHKTPGADCYIELSHSETNNEFYEIKSYGFTLNEDVFHIDVSGWAKGPYGGDSIGYPGWYVEADGGRETDAEVWKLEDELSLIIHLGVDIKVEDLSEIDFDEIEER